MAINQIHSQLITAPVPIREKYRDLAGNKLTAELARVQVRSTDPVRRAVLLALKTLATRCADLQQQHTVLGTELDQLVTAANPALRHAHGVGPDTAAHC